MQAKQKNQIKSWLILFSFAAMNQFTALEELVKDRRSIKPALMNGGKIDDTQIRQLLSLANWAPTHGFTEPWRFVVYSGDAVKQFCYDQAEMYKAGTDPDKFLVAKYEKLLTNGNKVSHLVVVYMKRGNNPNITRLEEICATAAAVQNILLGAEALGVAALWSTGGSILKPVMKDYLQLGEEDVVIDLLYLGYTNEPKKPGKRMAIEDKITWKQ